MRLGLSLQSLHMFGVQELSSLHLVHIDLQPIALIPSILVQLAVKHRSNAASMFGIMRCNSKKRTRVGHDGALYRAAPQTCKEWRNPREGWSFSTPESPASKTEPVWPNDVVNLVWDVDICGSTLLSFSARGQDQRSFHMHTSSTRFIIYETRKL